MQPLRATPLNFSRATSAARHMCPAFNTSLPVIAVRGRLERPGSVFVKGATESRSTVCIFQLDFPPPYSASPVPLRRRKSLQGKARGRRTWYGDGRKEGRGKEVAAAAGRGRSPQKILPLLEETGSPVWLFAFVSAGSRIAGSAEEATGAKSDHRVKIGCRDLSRGWESCQLARLFPNSHSNQPGRRRRKFDSEGIWFFSRFLFFFFPSHEGTFSPPSGRRGKKRRVPTILYI